MRQAVIIADVMQSHQSHSGHTLSHPNRPIKTEIEDKRTEGYSLFLTDAYLYKIAFNNKVTNENGQVTSVGRQTS